MMAGRGYVPFIILSSGRSGSNLIVSLLRSHPHVRCFGELLIVESKTVDFSVPGYDNENADDVRLRDSEPVALLERRIYGDHPAAVRAVGFKPMYQHLPFFPQVTEWLAAHPDLRVIHSKRRNALRRVVSFAIASESGQWIAPVTPESAARERPWRRALRKALLPTRKARQVLFRRKAPDGESKAVPLTREQCLYIFNWAKQEEAGYEERFRDHPVIDIYYEDLVADIPGVISNVQNFLDIENRRLTVGTTRQNPEPLRELIANYDELRATFRGTEYEPFFDD